MKFEQSFVELQRGFARATLSQSHRPQTITLGFLSKDLPATTITAELAQSLCVEMGASVVVLRVQRSEAGSQGTALGDQATVVDWAPCESVLQGQFRPGSLVRTQAGYDLLNLSLNSHWVSPDGISSLWNQLSRYYRHVLVEVAVDGTPEAFTLEFLARSDVAFLFLRPSPGDVLHLQRVTAAVCARDHNDTSRLKSVFCWLDRESGESLDAPPVKMSSRMLRDCPPALGDQIASGSRRMNRFSADVRRLAREISRRLVGLALSSGAAKGFAHIGVIQVLEENGIEVDAVAGASIGAYIGAVWTFGCDGTEMERLARELEGRWGFWRLFDPVFPPRQGFLRGFALRQRLMRTIGAARFADLPRPLRIIAGNLGSLEPTVFATGEVAAAVHASTAVPGICVPVSLNGESYIDGGIVDPVPVDALREMGVARVIAVNVIPTTERMKIAFEADRERARQQGGRRHRWFRKTFPLEQQLNYFAQGNLFEILARSIHGAQVQLAEASCRMADVVLRPDTGDDRWLDCRNPGKFIALGRQTAEEQIDQIKALVQKKQIEHEELAAGPLANLA